MISNQLLHRLGSLVASLTISAAAMGCSDPATGDDGPDAGTGVDPVAIAFNSINDPSPPLGLHLVPACRLIDTRGFGGEVAPYGAPILHGDGPSGEATRSPTREFPVQGHCGVPASAKAITVHIAATEAVQVGYLMIGRAEGPPWDSLTPLVASLNYVIYDVSADGTTLELGANGIRVFTIEDTHFVMDITGYYTEIPQPPIRVTPVGPVVAGVQQTSTNDWDALNNLCGIQGINNVPITFTNGEANTPPLGTGSFEANLFNAPVAANGAGLDSHAFDNRTIGDITGLRYSTRQDGTDTAYLTVNVDTTGGSTADRTLYFIPANNPMQGDPVGGGIWQTWDPFAGNWNIDGPVATTTPYNNDFSTTVGDWTGNPTPADGMVTLSPGGGTAVATGTPYTKWGGYSVNFPIYGYTTSLDVFIDTSVTGQWDFTSAINRNAAQSAIVGCDMTNGPGCHLRDFAFSVGATTAGQWHVSTSTQSPGDPAGFVPCTASPSTIHCNADITTSGWHTFEQNFHDNGSGVLEVTLTVKRGGSVVQSWIISNPSDVIALMVGGNRYGWFTGNSVPSLLIDNQVMTFPGGPGPDLGPGGTFPLSTYSTATILGVRAAMGCSMAAAGGHEAVDDFEIAFGGGPATIYDFERQ